MNILYNPKIEKEEKDIIEEAFGKNNVSFKEFKTKSLSGGSFDIQIIIDVLSDPSLSAYLNSMEIISWSYFLVKKLFGRNIKKIMDNNSRPKYTNLILRMETSLITISNVNNENKILISKTSSTMSKSVESVEYSEEKLKEFLK